MLFVLICYFHSLNHRSESAWCHTFPKKQSASACSCRHVEDWQTGLDKRGSNKTQTSAIICFDMYCLVWRRCYCKIMSPPRLCADVTSAWNAAVGGAERRSCLAMSKPTALASNRAARSSGRNFNSQWGAPALA